MSKELSIKSAESQFLALKAECETLTAQCSKLTITDATTLKIATQQYSLLKDKAKEVEDNRVGIKAPFWDACKQIDALAKNLSTPMETALEDGRKKVLAYNKIEKEKADAEQKRINDIKSRISKYSALAIESFDKCITEDELKAERDRWIMAFPGIINPDGSKLYGEPADNWGEFMEDAMAMRVSLNDYAKNRRIAINTPLEADPETEIAIKEIIEEAVLEVGAAEIEKAEYVAPKGITGKFVHEIVDETLVPRQFLIIDDVLIRKWIKENENELSDGMISAGIKFVWTENVKFK